MFTLRTLTTVGLVLVLAAGAAAADKRGQSGKNRGQRKAQQGKQFKAGDGAPAPSRPRANTAREAGSAMATGEKVVSRPRSGSAAAARSNGPTIVPTSNSAVKSKAAAGTLAADPDRPLGFTDDNGAPADGGISVKSRSSRKGPSITGQDQETGEIITINVKGKPMPKRPM